jgi:site-specific recombinase XerD
MARINGISNRRANKSVSKGIDKSRHGQAASILSTVSDKTFFGLFADFFNIHLPNEKKCSEHTVRAYRTSMNMLLDFVMLKKGVVLRDVTFAMIDRKMLLDFLDHIENERNCSVKTRNYRLQCIRAFYNYASDVESSAVAYWEEISKVHAANVPETIVEYMSESVVEAIISQPDVATRKGRRDMFLMLLLYQTAARIGELLGITMRDIFLDDHPFVILHGKGRKDRPVPLREKTVKHLEAYIRTFHGKKTISPGDYLFYVTRNGVNKRMSEDNARQIISDYGKCAKEICAEVPDNVHPHLFRHSRAMHLYQHGVDLTLVSQWLGHAHLKTTLIYAHADTEIKRKAIEQAIPEDSPLNEFCDTSRFSIDDEDEMLRKFCGLK